MAIGDVVEIASTNVADRTPALSLLGDLARVGVRGRLTNRTDEAHCILLRNRAVRHPEGYRISVRKNRVIVEAGSDAGSYYGVQTVRDLIAAHGTTVPCMEIEDEPELSRRGFYLDCSRGKVPTVETVRQLVRQLARWKVNELQLYIENVFAFAKHPRIGEGFSPYSAEDLRVIQETCKRHHVRFVPSLTSLGHFEKILMLDEYRDLGELPGFRDLPGGTTLNPLDPRSIELVSDLYDEFLPLFEAEDFNACGDEPWELGQGRSKDRAAEVGVGRVYLDFILKLRNLSIAHGKRMNLWGDILLKHPEIIPEIPPETVLLNWDYTPSGHMMVRTDEFAAAGLPLVCCPGTNCWLSHGTRLRTAMRNIHQFAGIAVEYNAEGLLNTNWGDAGNRNTLGASLHGIAYGAACSWNPGSAPDPEDDEFTRLFVRDVFGDSEGDLVEVIKTIGDDDYHTWAYRVLLESVREPVAFGEGFARPRPAVNEVDLDDARLRELIARGAGLETEGRLAGPVGDSAPPADMSEESMFVAAALQEYSLANVMNQAAARRVLLARALRRGDTVDPAELRAHRDEISVIEEALSRLWLARNRRSRLDDSLRGFEQGRGELDSLIG